MKVNKLRFSADSIFTRQEDHSKTPQTYLNPNMYLFYGYGISASLERLRRRIIAEFSENASRADQGVSLIGVAVLKYFLS